MESDYLLLNQLLNDVRLQSELEVCSPFFLHCSLTRTLFYDGFSTAGL